jgi:hypothetical protein
MTLTTAAAWPQSCNVYSSMDGFQPVGQLQALLKWRAFDFLPLLRCCYASAESIGIGNGCSSTCFKVNTFICRAMPVLLLLLLLLLLPLPLLLLPTACTQLTSLLPPPLADATAAAAAAAVAAASDAVAVHPTAVILIAVSMTTAALP